MCASLGLPRQISDRISQSFEATIGISSRFATGERYLYRLLPGLFFRLGAAHKMANDPIPGGRSASAAISQMNELIQHADRLGEILDASINSPPALRAESIGQAVGAKTGVETETIRAIFSALDNLRSLRGEKDTVDSTLDRVIDAFGKQNLPGIEAARPKIAKAIETYTDDNPIAIAIKAARLCYLYEKLYIDAEVITDVRPVYDVEGAKVLEFIINNVLVLSYHEDSASDTSHNHPRIHVAMDMGDIFKLREACDRAIRKGLALREELRDKARVLGVDD
ncbi:MAG TPA: hypothetical protein VHY79_04780 [Rhizomicrobium sp.]|jgi:hypothetical protein|nr:hypothetical protein [Rhizomicrobium sp.]